MQKSWESSVVTVIDVKRIFGNYEIYTNNGTKKSSIKLTDFIKIQEFGTGEITITILIEGTLSGLDLNLLILL